MKWIVYTLIVIAIVSCGDNDEEHEECKDECLEQLESERYQNVAVEFYLEHPEFTITEATFDTVTEQILRRDAYREGATFETVTEQVLQKDAYNQIKILSEYEYTMVVDARGDVIGDVPCLKFYQESEILETTIPASYSTISYEKNIADGTGAEVAAQYTKRSYLKLRTTALLETRPEGDRASKLINFTVPMDKTFDEYFQEQLAYYSNVDCGGSESYEIK